MDPSDQNIPAAVDCCLPLLGVLRRDPRRHLGATTAQALQLYLFAYGAARQDAGRDEGMSILGEFDAWMRKEHDAERGSMGWCTIIQWRLDPSDQNIGTFFERFDAFLRATHRPPTPAPLPASVADPTSQRVDCATPFLARIRACPGVYLGSRTARALRAYLRGYERGRIDLGLDGGMHLMHEFSSWLRDRQEVRDPAHDWCDSIEKQDPSDRSIETFYDVLDRFLEDTRRPLLA